jgi:WD40 repeat protein
MIVTGGEDATVRVWMPKTGVCKKVFTEVEGPITCIEMDNEVVIVGSEAGKVYIFSLTSLRHILTVDHAGDVDETIVSVECVGSGNYPTARWYASGGLNSQLKIWEQTGTCRSSCQHNDGVAALQWHPQLPIICTGSLDALVRIWDARNGTCLLQLSGHANQVTNLVLAQFRYHNDLMAAENEEIRLESQRMNSIVTISEDHTSKVFRVHFEALIA